MGPGLIAWIALMGGEFHLSVRQIQRLLAEQWSLPFSLGAISAAQGKAAQAMAAPYRQIGQVGATVEFGQNRTLRPRPLP